MYNINREFEKAMINLAILLFGVLCMIYTDLNLLHNSLEHLPNSYIYLAQLGWEKCNPDYSYFNCRDLHLIHFIYEGRGMLKIGDVIYHLQEKDAFYIPPNVSATYTADSKEPWHYYYFAFNGSFAPELIHRTVFRDSYCTTMPDNTLMQMIIDANAHINRSRAADIGGMEQLFRFISIFLRKDDQNKYALDSQHQYVSQIQRYIQLHFSETLRISQLADQFNINRSHLYRMFKDCIGMGPEQYLIDFRMNQAKQLLENGNISIAEVAQKVGYNNYTNFYTNFQKHTGFTPREYQQQHQTSQP